MNERITYLMENDQEIERLERKTDPGAVRAQADWAGIAPAMRVADIGCGSGKTTGILFETAQPGGSAVGIDISATRVAYAREKYARSGLTYICRDATKDLSDLGFFDLIWVRFLLEYYRSRTFEIVRNLARILKPGGILCLIDLDFNCLNHFGMPARLNEAIQGCMRRLEQVADFDPHVGIKLYSFLYDLGFEEIQVALAPHHLIYGQLKENDAFNWSRKMDVAVKQSGYRFPQYPGGYEEFRDEFEAFFSSPRRFTYTPVISCRGRKPL
jgi:SAM-dependent methyltransferase